MTVTKKTKINKTNPQDPKSKSLFSRHLFACNFSSPSVKIGKETQQSFGKVSLANARGFKSQEGRGSGSRRAKAEQ